MQISVSERKVVIKLPGGADSIRLINNVRNIISGSEQLKDKLKAELDCANISITLKDGIKGDISTIITSVDMLMLGKGESFVDALNYMVENYPEQSLQVVRQWIAKDKKS